MSHSHKRGARRSETKPYPPYVLDLIDVLFSLAENGDKAVSDAIAGSPAFQRLYRHATQVSPGWLQTPHSDPENGVAQADDEGLEVFQGRHHTEDE